MKRALLLSLLCSLPSLAAEVCSQVRDGQTCVQFFRVPYSLLAMAGAPVPPDRLDWAAYQIFIRTSSPEIVAFRVSLTFRLDDRDPVTRTKYATRSRDVSFTGADTQTGVSFDLPPTAQDIRVAVADLIVSEAERNYEWQ